MEDPHSIWLLDLEVEVADSLLRTSSTPTSYFKRVSAPPFTPCMAVHLLIGSLLFSVCVLVEGRRRTLATSLHGIELHGSPGQRHVAVKLPYPYKLLYNYCHNNNENHNHIQYIIH